MLNRRVGAKAELGDYLLSLIVIVAIVVTFWLIARHGI